MATPNPLIRNNVNVVGNLSSDQTMIFVHGFGTDQGVWKDVATPFLGDYKVYLMDNVGSANTSPDDFVQHRYLNLERYAQDMVEVLEALDVKGAIAVGHSVGGMICLLAAVKAPERFSRLVLIGASPRYQDDDGYCGGLTGDGIDKVYSAALLSYEDWTKSFGFATMANPDRPELARQFVESLRKIPRERTLTVLCSILQSDYRNILPQVVHPTLILQARRDSIVPMEVAEYLKQRIRDSYMAIIDGGRAFSPCERPRTGGRRHSRLPGIPLTAGGSQKPGLRPPYPHTHLQLVEPVDEAHHVSPLVDGAVLGAEEVDFHPGDPLAPVPLGLIGAHPAAVEALRVADMGVEIGDEQPGLGGQEGSPHITGEEKAGGGIVEVEVARGMEVMGRHRLEDKAAKADVHSLVGDGDQGLVVAPEVGDESRPQPADVALQLGFEIQPQGQGRDDVRVLVRGENGLQPVGVAVVGKGGEDRREDFRAAGIGQQRPFPLHDEVLIGIHQEVGAGRVPGYHRPGMVALLE